MQPSSRPSVSRNRCVHAIMLLLVVVALVAAPSDRAIVAQANTVPQLFLQPSTIAPRGDLRLSGVYFPPNQNLAFPIRIYGPLPLTENLIMGDVRAELDGSIKPVSLPVEPDLDPGDYLVKALDLNGNVVAEAPLTVGLAPEVQLTPAEGPPGTLVLFRVTNLLAGSLRLDYDGAAVAGPLPVADGAYEGVFIVPRDRPQRLGDGVTVQASNLFGDQLVGAGTAFFQSSNDNPAPVYKLDTIVLPTTAIDTGAEFTISGQISPVPARVSDVRLMPLWKSADNKVIPIGTGASEIATDGRFDVVARMPDIYTGDAASAGLKGEVGVALLTPYNLYTPAKWEDFGKTPGPKLSIRLVNPEGQPIANAFVGEVHDRPGTNVTGSPTIPGQPAFAALGNAPADDPLPGDGIVNDPEVEIAGGPNNQMQAMEVQKSQVQPAQGCAFHDVVGKTDANGMFTFPFEPEDLNKTINIVGNVAAGGKIGPFKTTYGVRGSYNINVLGNAAPLGYGTLEDEGARKGLPREIEILRTLEYRSNGVGGIDGDEGYFYRGTNTKVTLPIVISMPRLTLKPSGFLDEPTLMYPRSAQEPNVLLQYTGTRISVRNVVGAIMPPANPGAYAISLGFNRGDGGTFQAAELFLRRPNEPEIRLGNLAPFDPATRFGLGSDSYCNPTNGVMISLPDAPWRLFAPGTNTIRAFIKLSQVEQPFERTWTFSYSPPPAWFANANSPMQRRLVDYPQGIGLVGSLMPPPADKSASVPKVGPLTNRAGAESKLTQDFFNGTNSGPRYSTVIPVTALNKPSKQTPPYQQNGDLMVMPDRTIRLFDTGRVPLFRYVWGVWPIASATLGADIWFNATLTYGGQIRLQNGQPTETTLKVFPQATVGVEVFLDVSALFGLIEARASAVPEINVCMPVTFTNGQRLAGDMRFRYRLDVRWSASVGWCPFCVSAGGTENIFSGGDPPCPGAGLTGMHLAAGDDDVPSLRPSIATDGYGHTALAYIAENQLRLRTTADGRTWTDLAQPVTTDKAVDRPQIAAYAPGRYLLAWGQNGLSPEELQATASLTDALKLQHLAYATASSEAASAPRNLTAPGSSEGGEGNVVLASCVAGVAGCPAGGEVTAVWIRSVSPNLGDRQFRLYASRFRDGLWSEPAPIDPAYPAELQQGPTDSEPTVAYRNGIATVVWVRDVDRDLATADDRRLWIRALGGNAAAAQIPVLPAGVTAPSLAYVNGSPRLAFNVAGDGLIGNQTSLHMARQVCGANGCFWREWEAKDLHGRSFRVERPRLLVTANQELAVKGRGLGYIANTDGVSTFPEDPPTLVTGTGTAVTIPVTVPGEAHQAIVANQGTIPEWEVVSAYDSIARTTHTVAVKLLSTGQIAALTGTNAVDDTSALELTSTPDLPEFAVGAVVPNARFPQDGGPLVVTAAIRNQGSSWKSSGQPLDIVATWDGPAGLGTLAGRTTLNALQAGAAVSVSMILAAPQGTLDRPHTLTITANPAQAIMEHSGTDNARSADVGGIPAPGPVRAYSPWKSVLAFLEWEPVEDTRVAGYRIYRLNDDGERTPLGSSFVTGWVDTATVTGNAYRYVVTAYTAGGAESDPSPVAELRLGDISPPHVFVPMLIASGTNGNVVGTGSPASCTEQTLDEALARGGTIRFNCGRATIVVTNQKVIRRATHILGDNLITISGGDTTSIFKVEAGVALTLDDLVLTDGRGTLFGGAVESFGTLVLHHTTVQNSTLPDDCMSCVGAGIASRAGRLELYDSRIIGNTGGSYGGGIATTDVAEDGAFSSSVHLIVRDSLVQGNRTTGSGGGILADGFAEISTTTISNNRAEIAFGGGVATFTGTLTLANSVIEGNYAGRDGGGIIFSTHGGGSGGPRHNTHVEVRDSRISQNATGTQGEGLGGGMYVGGEAKVSLVRVTVNDNASLSGGGLYAFYEGADVRISQSTFNGNRATAGYGGGLEVDGGTIALSNVTVSGNSAALGGGGIYAGGRGVGTPRLDFVTLWANSAPEGANLGQTEDITGTTVRATIVGNPLGGGTNCTFAAGAPFQSGGHNLVSDASCGLADTGDQSTIDPQLGPLADNGGPTQTHLPRSISPAIDAGGTSCPPSDQRGDDRPAGIACDIGAVEDPGTVSGSEEGGSTPQ